MLDARDDGRVVVPAGFYVVPDTQSMTGYPQGQPYQGTPTYTALPPQGYPAASTKQGKQG